MKKKIALFLGLLFVANVSYAEIKIGVVNLREVLEKSPQLDKATKRFEQEFSPRKKQLLSIQDDIQKKEEKMAKNSAVMSATERGNLEKDIINKKRDAQRAMQEFQEDANVRRNEELGKIQHRVLELIRSIAKEQHIDLVLEDPIYAGDSLDITAQVMQKLNAQSE